MSKPARRLELLEEAAPPRCFTLWIGCGGHQNIAGEAHRMEKLADLVRVVYRAVDRKEFFVD